MKFDARVGALVPVRLFNLEDGAVGKGAGFAPLASASSLNFPTLNEGHPLACVEAAAFQKAGAAGPQATHGSRCAAVLTNGQVALSSRPFPCKRTFTPGPFLCVRGN